MLRDKEVVLESLKETTIHLSDAEMCVSMSTSLSLSADHYTATSATTSPKKHTQHNVCGR